MPRLLKTLSQYAVERKKEETYFMVFNTVYNDLYAFKNEPNSEENAEYGIFGYLNPDYAIGKFQSKQTYYKI